ncbi:MAG: DUF2085 domain-containing protein [Candidatus Calescibacterium sp.]|nr:DUF2085 domain-containing protein [Candidatus Calescibacterium sp.]MCX7758067.1 DUF2085 domain-containing protein [bacterium]
MEKIYDFFFTIFSPFCHQITERSFQSFDGYQFFVCSRDTGTYLGFLLSYTLYFYNKSGFRLPIIPIAILFFVHLLIFGLDGVSSYAGWRETNNLIRYFTGFYLGFFLGIVFQYVEFFLFKPSNISYHFKRNEYFYKPLMLEIYCSLLFTITFVSISYLLYLTVFAIIFYVYKIVKLILNVLFMFNRGFYYYLAFFLVFVIFWVSVFITGIYKINVVHKLYH